MEIKIRYMANDGEFFDTEEECVKHCIKINNLLKKLKNNEFGELAFFDEESVVCKSDILSMAYYSIEDVCDYVECCKYIYIGNLNNKHLKCLKDLNYIVPDSIGFFKWNYKDFTWNKIFIKELK